MNDFEVVQQGDACLLKGHLVDSTPIENWAPVLKDSREIDLSGLYTFSWIGITKLVEMMAGFGRKVDFVHIPFDVYKVLLVFPQLGNSVDPRSVEVEIRSGTEHSIMTYSMDDLVGLAFEQGCFVQLPGGKRLSGSLAHICRPAFIGATPPQQNLTSDWCRDHAEECLFWYDYFCFLRTTLDMCALAQASTARLLEESLQQMCMRIQAAEFALKVLFPDFNEGRSRRLLGLLPQVQTTSHAVVDSLKNCRHSFDEICDKMEDIFQCKEGSSIEFFDTVARGLQLCHSMEPIAKNLDDTGYKIGRDLFEYGEMTSVRKKFESFDASGLTEKNIASLRRKFRLDGSLRLTWVETLEDIQSELKVQQRELERCVIAMQGFDLVKQVIEHRLNEAHIGSQNLEAEREVAITWESVRNQILTAAMDKLVTDQEKFSFKFFFPNAESSIQPTEKLSPGDALFF